MGMSSPTVPGQIPGIERTPSTHVLPFSRQASSVASLLGKETGLNQRVPSMQVGREPTVVVKRKKLPWLGGKPGKVPGAFEPKESIVLETLPAADAPPLAATPPEATAPSKRHSATSLSADPSLRAVGSTPSLRRLQKAGQVTRTLSLNSHPRPGVKAAATRQQAKRALGVHKDKQAKVDDYTPSEYSTTISSDADPTPDTPPPKKTTAAYQHQVQKAVARKQRDTASHEQLAQNTRAQGQAREGPLNFAQDWLQSQLDLPLDEIAPRSEKRKCKRADSCDSCNANEGDEPHGVSPKTSAVRRRATSVPSLPAQVPSSPPKDSVVSTAQPTKRSGTTVPKPTRNNIAGPLWSQATASRAAAPRKETLHPMPQHLFQSSSSSTDIPPHLRMTSTEVSSSSPDLSPRGTLKPLPALPPQAAVGSRGLRRETRDLNQAVTGLEDLMEEALAAAKDAERSGRQDDVAHILESASAALRRASTAMSPKCTVVGRRRTNEPLQLSPHESGASSDSSDSGDSMHRSGFSTPGHSRDSSVETAPTLITAQSSQQPLLATEYTNRGAAPEAQRGVIDHAGSSGDESISRTPPRLHQPASADSIVRDFAYAKLRDAKARAAKSLSSPAGYGAAADFYNDHGESVAAQPGLRRSIALEMMPGANKPLPEPPVEAHKPAKDIFSRMKRHEVPTGLPHARRFTQSELRELEHVTTNTVPTSRGVQDDGAAPDNVPQRRKKGGHRPHISDFFESSYYRQPEDAAAAARKSSSVTDTSGPSQATILPTHDLSLKYPRRKHISLREGQGFSLGRYHRRQPIAREWNTVRKRIAATIACFNTVFIGLIAGIYAGEVPAMQYQIADVHHNVILGNVLLFAGLGLTTLIFWPLPLLHGRKPYTLMAFALMLPLQFPQALAVSSYRDPTNPLFRCGLLMPRIFTGIAMGFANINQLPTLLDLFGSSLMSERPHQEIVVVDDVRRQGGGVGIWLGIWSFSFVASLSIGFCIGACIISTLDPAWGFYIVVMLLAFFLLVNVIAPETRRAPYRRSIAHFFEEEDGNQKLRRRVARGEVMLHISNDGPKWWFQEVWAGLILTKRMAFQPGFFVLMVYIAWIYAQVTLVILLLGALLSRDYKWQPQYVGAATLSLAIGAFFAIPLAKASIFSRARFTPQRTDSMTMRAPRLTWSSHLMRRCIFTLLLPFAGLAYTLSAPGPRVSWTTPTIFCGLVGFLSNLAIAECVGLIMDTFDTCDLQPGVNQKHRLQSMAETTRRRRTNYSSFPRVCAGFFAAQSLGFFLAAAATGVSGDVTRALGAQEAVAVVAGILLVITLLFMAVMWRWKEVQVIPNGIFGGTKKGSIAWGPGADDPEWKPVVIGNPSGKMRRVNLLELGSLTRWTEIRKLNKLVRK
ncbi:hypothetical protein LTR85_011709 [Meristemomyces frigidus]|nr:hypothetical protein LTR85_011709 [Meristemomyces frigidus]